ncbi:MULTISPECIES: protein kinase [unclassified Streptomyces]|uniref:protein kinase domain-containing protein n=1 Tax=unclassified Streptomyces TaxID=2593676 RepID=UPI00336ADE88
MDDLLPADPDQIGPYVLEGRLGAGGMGQVYLGRSPGGRHVAVKVIRPEHARNPQFRRRFAREVEAARLVGGFHTAQVIAADPDAPSPWLATAYIPGPSLHEVVTTGGPLAPDALRALGAGLAEGLAAIHGCGLVHRDLKPGNVIMADDGPRIIDFGIARSADASALTSLGVVIGTFAFMSPEQVRADQAGPASDVFSLGAVLGFAATGHGPFDAETIPAIVHRIISEPPRLGGLSGALRDTVEACLAKEPDDRPGIADVLARLAPSGQERPGSHNGHGTVVDPTAPVPLAARDTEPAAVQPPTTADRTHVARPSRRAILGMAGGAAVLIGGGVIAAKGFGGGGDGGGGKGTGPVPKIDDVAEARPLWRSSVPRIDSLIAYDGGVLWMGARPDSDESAEAVWSFDTAGNPRWKLPLLGLDTLGTRGVCAGVIREGMLCLGAGGPLPVDASSDADAQVVAVDLARGKRAWSAPVAPHPYYIGSISGGRDGIVYATGSTIERGTFNMVWAVDIASRRKIWEREFNKAEGFGTVVVPPSGNRVFHLLSTYGGGQQARLQVLSARKQGAPGWTAPLPEATGNVSELPNLCAVGDTLIYAADRLIAVDPATGVRIWTKRRPAKAYGGFGIPAANANGSQVFVTTQTEDAAGRTTLTLHALDPRSGEEKWRSSVIPEGKVGLVNLLVADSTVYVLVGQRIATDVGYYYQPDDDYRWPFIWAVNAANGKSRWRYRPSETFEAAAGFGRVYVAIGDSVTALSATGK